MQESGRAEGKKLTIENDNRELVNTKLVPSDHFKCLFECTIAARKDDKAARRHLGHFGLALLVSSTPAHPPTPGLLRISIAQLSGTYHR